MTLTTRILGPNNLSDGTTVTTGNSSADTLVSAGGSTLVYATSKGPAGTLTGLKYTNVTNQTCVTRFLFPGSATNNNAAWTFRMWTPESAPSASITLFSVRYAAGRAFNVSWTVAGLMFLNDSANTITTIAAAGVLALNTQYIVTLVVTGNSTTAGDVYIRVYAIGSGTPVASLHVTNANLTANPLAAIELGGTNPGVNILGFSNLQMNDGATTELADYNTSPTLNAGVDQSVSPGATVNLSAIASDADQDTLTYNWTVTYSSTTTPTLTGSTTATPSFTATSTLGSLYILQCVVTDTKGVTATDTIEVQVLNNGDFTTLPGNGNNGAWTMVGSASTIGDALADASDTTLVQSPNYAVSESETRIRLQPLSPRSSLQLNVRSLVSTVGGVTKVRLYANSTLKQEWSVTQSLTAANQTLTVSQANLPTGAEWGSLYIAPVVSS